ncbi:MAG TPA: hypothetical protein VGR02_09210 [Thermoanaerobaculia bacterium]|jgi:hypothetical protein|nr:hypothetical protein [Thermoanaerobaculia bacterium]
MKRLLLLSTLVATLATASPRPPAERALSKHPSIANPAIAELRAQGQAGVDALALAASKLTGREERERARLALDRVCRQRDCYASRLYWFTDLGAAKAEAKKLGKPILSLRLLGNLDDDLSCANSRFFRTTLYSDPKIAAAMREHFVLHWSSERPVPQVTIDFGDGRKLRQTITGNSVHYLLDADGRPLDALPGLYSPERFLIGLNELASVALRRDAETLRAYHEQALQNAYSELSAEFAPPPPPPAPAAVDEPVKIEATLRYAAILAAPVASTKMSLETPLLASLGQTIPDARWKDLAAKHAPEVRFAPESIALMKEKYGATDAMLVALQRSVAEDTLRNEYDLHARIHQWFAVATRMTFHSLNKSVYAQLFLTPRTDPWLGLQPNAFSAIAAK